MINMRKHWEVRGGMGIDGNAQEELDMTAHGTGYGVSDRRDCETGTLSRQHH